MKDALSKKIDDYCAYVVQAVKNFKAKQYGDSASNCRKAAEAACKILFFNAYSLKLAEEKCANKSLKELILLVIRDNVGERKAINNLEALQIVGNKAAHDNTISSAEAAYALNALDLLTQYLFVEKLKIRMPAALDFDLTDKKVSESKPEIIEKIIIRESTDPDREKEILQKFLQIEQQNQELKTQIHRNAQELKQIGELQQARDSTLKDPNETILPIKIKKKKFATNKVFIILIVSLVLISTVIYLLPAKNSNLSIVPVIKQGDTIYVAINKITILQDNPNLDFKIEALIEADIKKKSIQLALPIKCIIADLEKSILNTDTGIINHAKRLNFDVVYWGNLYESSLADSTILEIKGTLTNRSYFIRNKKIKFKSLADSTFIKEINDQTNTPIYQYCLAQEGKKEYKKLAEIMGGLHSYSMENFLSMNESRSLYLEFSGDHKKALTLLREMIALVPNLNFYNTISNVYINIHQYDSAALNLKRAHDIDSNYTPILFTYAVLNIYLNKNDIALNYLAKILKIDKTNKAAAFLFQKIKNLKKGEYISPDDYNQADTKANELFLNKQYAEAIIMYKKSGDILNFSANKKTQVAICYYYLGDTANSLKYLKMAELQDSTDENTVLSFPIMAENIPALSKKTDFYFRKAIRLYPKNRDLIRAASGYYMRSRNFEAAVNLGIFAEKDFLHDRIILDNTGLAANLLKKYTIANSKYELLNLLYPSDTTMAYLAQSYLSESNGNIYAPNFKKGLDLIKKAYAINPNNDITLGVLNRYTDAGIKGLESNPTNSQLPLDVKKNLDTYKKLKEQEKGSILLFSNNTLTITAGISGNTFTKLFSNKSKSSITHVPSGVNSSSISYSNGQGPPINEKFPTDRQLIDFVFSNKTLPQSDLVNFLKAELEYHKSRVTMPNKQTNETRALINHLNDLIRRVQKN